MRSSSRAWRLAAIVLLNATLLGAAANDRKSVDDLKLKRDALDQEVARKRAIRDLKLPADFVPNLHGRYSAQCWFADTPDSKGTSTGFIKIHVGSDDFVNGVVVHDSDLEDDAGRPISIEAYDLRDADIRVTGKVSGTVLNAVGEETFLGKGYKYLISGHVRYEGDGRWSGSGSFEGKDRPGKTDPLLCQGKWSSE